MRGRQRKSAAMIKVKYPSFTSIPKVDALSLSLSLLVHATCHVVQNVSSSNLYIHIPKIVFPFIRITDGTHECELR